MIMVVLPNEEGATVLIKLPSEWGEGMNIHRRKALPQVGPRVPPNYFVVKRSG